MSGALRLPALAVLGALVLAVLAPAPAEAGPPRPIEMADGSRLIGRVLADDCTDELLVIRTVPQRRKLSIPWDKVKPSLAHELRVQLGFEVPEKNPEEMLVDAHSIRNRAGNLFTGKWVNEDSYKQDGYYLLKTSEGDRRIRLSDVREPPTPLEVDALEVYTPDELYERKKNEQPPETAEDHFKLGEYARIVTAYGKAKMHYEKAVELGYARERLQRLIDTVDRLIDSREALEELKTIRRNIVHKNYERAKDMIVAFREKHAGQQALLDEVAQQEKALVDKREKYYVDRVARMVRDEVKRLCWEKARQEEITLRDAQQYAGGDVSEEGSVSREAIELVAKELELEPAEALEFWGKRRRVLLRAFYRDGTFTAVEDLEDAMANAPKIKPKQGGPKPPRPRKRMTPEPWWEGKVQTRKYAQLRDYLYAWWAEHSGMNEVIDPKDQTCPTCAGKGYTQQMHTAPEGIVPFYDRCATCHMAKVLRVVRFK